MTLIIHPEGPGSVAGAPHVPEGFTSGFTSRYVDASGHQRAERAA